MASAHQVPLRLKHGLPCVQILLVFCLPAFSQHPGATYNSFEEFMEVMAEKQGDGEADAAFLEELQDLHQHPVRINEAEMEELLRIPFLNEVSATSILEWRRRYKAFYSVYELASVPGIGRELAEKISWFISAEAGSSATAGDTLPRRRGIHELLSRYRITFPFAGGYTGTSGKPPAYAGNPLSVYTKYTYEQKKYLSIACQGDKDPGETFFRGTNRMGFDFYSGHISLELNGFLRRVTVGDFTVRTGQGLVCWQGFSMGKSAEVMQASRNTTLIKPYASSDETRFFRGVAVSGRHKNLAAHLYFSSRRSDGNITADDQGVKRVTSLQASGYHRTASEMADEKSVRQNTAGFLLTLYHPKVKTGVTGLVEHFGLPRDPGNQLYEQFYFRGRFNVNLSADYHFISGRYHLFGEAAVSRSGGMAFVQGMEAELHDQLKATFLFRSYGKKYHATWAGAFGAGTAANSETGWYAGLRFLPAAGITLSAWADWFSFPWIKYGTAAPARGHDLLLQADFTPRRRFSGYIRYKTSLTPEKESSGNMYENGETTSGNLRFHAKLDFRNLFSLTWRAEWSGFPKDSSGRGMLLLQDLSWTPAKFPVSASMRISGFWIPAWEKRIYAYENDLLYSFSTFSFNGNGVRSYLRIKVEMAEALSLWFKTGLTWYPGVEHTGSGAAQKPGNIIRDVKIQIRYRF